ncbi:hypothetical protein [Cupriavidus sp. USMAHM13]|uniref:hypothetical protein n=1 Tax=Cupriavidus sp. USMAHM13 TaxID=1389192 RepID=UPI003FA49505
MTNPEHTLSAVRRLIGRRHEDKAVQKDIGPAPSRSSRLARHGQSALWVRAAQARQSR